MDEDSLLLSEHGGLRGHGVPGVQLDDYGNDGLSEGQPHYLSLAQAEATFNQERSLVAKIPREDLEDRYLRLLEENIVIKKHSFKQEEKLKKMATKLIRLVTEKKNLISVQQVGGQSGGNTAMNNNTRDLETEDLIEDLRQHIRDLDKANSQLKDKLMVAKQQLLSTGPSRGLQSKRNLPRGIAHPMKMNRQADQEVVSPGSGQMIVPPMMPYSNSALLSQQAQSLLEEARNENRMLEDNISTLKEQVNIFEQEIEQVKEQAKIRESNLEEEIGALREQIRERECQNVSENLTLIRLQQDKKSKTNQISTLEAQLQALEEQLTKLKSEEATFRRENFEMSSSLQEEQKKVVSLTQELSTNISSRQALLESEEKIRDLQKENSILRESNNKLLDSAYSVEVERQYHATENALKVQIAQLESTLKSDLVDKKKLMEALSKEREAYAKLESEFKDIQAKYFDVKEAIEGREEQFNTFAKEHSVSQKDLEDALAMWNKRKSGVVADYFQAPPKLPEFMEKIGDRNDKDATLKSEYADLQTHHVEAINELEKTRALLRVQGQINSELQREIDALQSRLHQVKGEYQIQLNEHKKLLELRATRIHKLELQLREQAYGRIMINRDEASNTASQAVLLHGRSGQSMFEMHIHKVKLTQETLISLASLEPSLFATWTFYDHDLQYTPVVSGPTAFFDCSALYKIKVDDAFLDYLSENSLQIELHLATDSQDKCKPIGHAYVKLKEVLDFPSNKLHGSVVLYSSTTQKNQPAKTNILGTLEYWFKLHIAGNRCIQDWQDHKRELERAAELLDEHQHTIPLDEVQLIAGEERQLLEKALEGKVAKPRKVLDEPVKIPPVAKQRVSILSTRKQKEVTLSSSDAPYESQDGSGSRVLSPAVSKTQESEPEAEETLKVSSEKSLSSGMENEGVQRTKKGLLQRLKARESVSGASSPVKTDQIIENEAPAIVPLPSPIRVVSNNQAESETANERFITVQEKSVKDEDESSEMSSVSDDEDEQSKTGQGSQEEDDEDSTEEDDNEEEKTTSAENKESSKLSQSSQNSHNVESKVKPPKVIVDSLLKSVDSKGATTGTSTAASTTVNESVSGEEEPSSLNNEDDQDEEESSKEEETEEDEDDEDDEEEDSEEESEEEESEESNLSVKGETSKTETESENKKSGSKKDESSRGSTLQASTEASQPSDLEESSSEGDTITITVSEFKAAKGARFLKNKKIHSLYVEYRFLDLPMEETETFSLPKPQTHDEPIVFNIRKEILVDKENNKNRRRALEAMLSSSPESVKSGAPKTSTITFNIVSEPPENEGKCEEVGYATFDLDLILLSGEDMIDHQLDVFSAESRTKVGRLLHGSKPIGSLTVSVEAADVLKSLKINSE